MLDNYFNKLKEFSLFSQAEKDNLTKYITIKKVQKGNYILNSGEVCNHIYFLNQGFARQYYYKNGKEVTEWFAGKNEFCFSIESYFKDSPSKLLIETIEDSEVIYLHKEGLLGLSKSNIEIGQLAIKMFAKSLVLSQQRMESILFQSAKDRYVNLLERQPEIIQKVPLSYIASFLGITQETLSRIRAKLN
ncbi:Crp/Fnr family transcriptional regulator [Leeuwenhoekiella marinoflava]|uniref:CRP-like cAMP-binding protein n=2 Tax=Leeuwenhoekiella marinoflava TaxID=988 RepID=A0A4Q0PQJ4_9FLAO|nr:Crp/Fnr family transcriptional regulator [Leeuwenhoekiella marinoflava]RXG32125.1 CRP-like cAMP-binding protein [Leeuwenhoekiella marinoflava]SHE86252.1 cAMP-binding domain of CRP or a regulatory subunit of cAMP-dependent protein kinases [Leeuwenhoekiella marinoflava DSM 3653]